jgi:glutamate 5-kinase
VAQILLTGEDLNNRKRYLNARNTLNTLLEWKVVPIINENDTVMVEEIKLGDNDNLAAMITLLMDADFLINLTDIDGLYTKDPAHPMPTPNPDSPGGQLQKRDRALCQSYPRRAGARRHAQQDPGRQKGHRRRRAHDHRQGQQARYPAALFAGESHGTYFAPQDKKLASRKCWIAYTLTPKGSLVSMPVPKKPCCATAKACCPAASSAWKGQFGQGEPAAPSSTRGTRDRHRAGQLQRGRHPHHHGPENQPDQERLGGKPYDEVIHRDNLVITSE